MNLLLIVLSVLAVILPFIFKVESDPDQCLAVIAPVITAAIISGIVAIGGGIAQGASNKKQNDKLGGQYESEQEFKEEESALDRLERKENEDKSRFKEYADFLNSSVSKSYSLRNSLLKTMSGKS